MSDVIAKQLAGLYRELADRQPFSDVVRVELSATEASGRATGLLICQCDCDDLQLLSFFRKWWLVDAEGLHSDVEWPLNRALVQREGWEADFPFIKFATDGHRIRFGMKFGPRWYVVKEGPIGPDGRFVAERLLEEYRYIE